MRVRFLLAIIAGLLLAAAFPKIGIAGFAWLAPGLLLATTLGRDGRDAFRLGYAFGLAFNLASLYWLVLIPGNGFQLLGWLALAGYCAAYPATWVWLTAKLSPFTIHDSRFTPSVSTWLQRTLFALSGAAIWVALEMILARLFTGFPFLPIGVSQQKLLPLTQIASFTGVCGISFLVVWTSLALENAAAVILAQPARRGVWLGEIILPIVAIVAAMTFGFHQLSKPQAPARELAVTFIQPSIPQTAIWDARENKKRFTQLLEMSERALNETKPDLLLWPEAAIPEMLRWDDETLQAVAGLARKHEVWMIVGSDDAEPDKKNPANTNGLFFNCSFLVTPDGAVKDRYQKQRLVIFGEYVPLVRWLPFIKWFTPITGSFEPGAAPAHFDMKELGAKTSVLICFEDIFPQHTRSYVSDDTDFLVNITNDGWFGEGSQQWQHAANASFRAIENGIPLLRCCNNGVTCWIDSNGRFQKIFTDDNKKVYGAGFMTAKIPLLTEKRAPTYYNRHGDRFGWACVIFSAMLAVRQFLHARILARQA